MTQQQGLNFSPDAGKMSDFQILKKLGDGAYSSVYKARRLSDNQVYALK